MRKVLGILGLVLPFKALASSVEDKAHLSFDFYADNTEVEVYSPTLSFFKTFMRKLVFGIKVRIDAISAASIRKGSTPKLSDAVTGASERRVFDDVRYAVTSLGTYDDSINTFTFGAYYSTERDYTGRSLFLNYTRQLNLQNTAVGVGLSQSFDEWHPVFDRRLSVSYRRERKLDISLTQLLSPTSLAQLTYSNIYSEGFLASPYHYLLKEGFARFETLPTRRQGHAFAIRLVKLINEPTSLNLLYRYYTDDWRINSHTADLKLWRDVSDSLTIGFRYRYYNQSEADFTKPIADYTLNDRYVVVDYRYSSFSSNTFGVLFIKGLSGELKLKGSINYYVTSKNEYIKNWYGEERIQAWFGSISLDYSF